MRLLLVLLSFLFSFCYSEIVEITSIDQFHEARNQEKTFILAYAIWCGPCKKFRPSIEEAAANHPDIQFFAVDVDAHEDVAGELRMGAMPTSFVFKNGQLAGDLVGASSSKMLGLLDRLN